MFTACNAILQVVFLKAEAFTFKNRWCKTHVVAGKQPDWRLIIGHVKLDHFDVTVF